MQSLHESIKMAFSTLDIIPGNRINGSKSLVRFASFEGRAEVAGSNENLDSREIRFNFWIITTKIIRRQQVPADNIGDEAVLACR